MSDLEEVTPPAAEPLTLEQAKAWLRVDGDDDDGVITALIKGARMEVEAFTRLRLITQTVEFTLAAFPGRIRIPTWPVQSVESVSYIDDAGEAQTMSDADWTLVTGRRPREIAPAYGLTWPSTRAHWNAVTVKAVVGYGGSGADVPADILAAMRLIIATRFDFRSDAVVGTVAAGLPVTARTLLMPHVLY
ncbi:MAG: head-tail connector protein [Pseudomonadota bacterium]|nr:head-tail connector protein [Pseudomonadota bacterium]MEE3098754.1 head-tail connector protein [Pseudomonadota bacterium]